LNRRQVLRNRCWCRSGVDWGWGWSGVNRSRRRSRVHRSWSRRRYHLLNGWQISWSWSRGDVEGRRGLVVAITTAQVKVGNIGGGQGDGAHSEDEEFLK